MKNETNEINFKIMTADFQILQAVSVWAKIETHDGIALVPEVNQSERRHIMTERFSIKGVRKGDAVMVNQPLPNLFLKAGEIGEVAEAWMYAARVKFPFRRKLDIDLNFLDRVANVPDSVVEDPDPQMDGINRGRLAEKIGMRTAEEIDRSIDGRGPEPEDFDEPYEMSERQADEFRREAACYRGPMYDLRRRNAVG